MNLTDNPHLRIVRHSIWQFRAHELDIEGLQQNIASVLPAMEGDIPKEIRDAITDAENSMELIRFTVNSNQQTAAVEDVLQEIESILSKYVSGE